MVFKSEDNCDWNINTDVLIESFILTVIYNCKMITFIFLIV